MSIEVKSIYSVNPDNSDEAKLAAFGYKQEFNRSYDFFFIFLFCLFNLWAPRYNFHYFGLSDMVGRTCWYRMVLVCRLHWLPRYWMVGCIGCLAIGWSVAEITSCFPTSGGMYYVISHLVPKKHVPVLCWINGWLYIVGAITGPAAADFGAATLLMECISMRSGYTYIPTNGHITAVTILILISQALINSIPSGFLAKITKYYCVVNICTTIALIVNLLVKCPKINSREYTFGTVINSTGWSHDGWAFLFGFLQVSWVMTCYDATSRMSEEAYNAAYYIPLAIGSALVANAILGWALVIVLVLCMGPNINAILSSESDQPLVAIFDYAMGTTASTAYLSLTFAIIWFSGAAAFCYISRSLWSFSRDGLFPFSHFWYSLDSKTGQPIRCVWLLCFIDSCLILINLGSSIAMNAIFSANAICTDWSYVMVIAIFLFRSEKAGIQKGPFNLGRFSKPVMAYACLWTLFVSIVFVFPNYMPVNKENMNYTVLIIGFSFIFSGLWYVLDAKKWYKGPMGSLDNCNADATTENYDVEDVENVDSIEPGTSGSKEKPHARIVVNDVRSK